MKIYLRWSLVLLCLLLSTAGFHPIVAQAEKCPKGSKFVGNIEGQGSFNKNLNMHQDVVLPEGVALDSAKQQTTLKPAGGGSDSRSDMPASSVPAGIFINPYGSEDHEKGWAIHSPTLVTAAGPGSQTSRLKFGLTLYCTTGSGEIDRFVGDCFVKVPVCIFVTKSDPAKKADAGPQ
jgi:hypothetical protein